MLNWNNMCSIAYIPEFYENGGVWHEREYGNRLDEFINRKSIYLNDTLQYGDEKHI
ncbi:MAG: hypothetical protein PHQ76_06295 [Caldisericia bacterium]|jgi:hypothetical protein|nr:hypothetical protein [Caldisericia bacterium]